MPRTGGKRGATKSSSQTGTPAKTAFIANSNSAASTGGTDSSIPHPFEPVSPALRPLSSTLPTDHIYIVHVDRTPIVLKKRVFVVPVLLNILISAVLAVRVYYAAPAYLELLITTFGYETSWTVDKPQSLGARDAMNLVTSRTMFLMIDYCLFGLLGRWPWEFVMGDRKYGRGVGAVEWRRTVGFQNNEIVVRKGRKWDAPFTDLNADGDEGKHKGEQRVREGKPAKSWTKEEELTVQMRLEQALRKDYTTKTGYLLLDRDWDLDFKGMVDAHQLLEKKRVKMEDLDGVALVNVSGQWGMWFPHGQLKNELNGAAAKQQALDQDKRLQTFKTKLTDMGCETVFYRWIEMVQYETSQSGGFTEAKKAEAVTELKRMIKDRGKDDRDLWQAIGGLQGVPGLEEAG